MCRNDVALEEVKASGFGVTSSFQAFWMTQFLTTM
jgi:hypothetical protein